MLKRVGVGVFVVLLVVFDVSVQREVFVDFLLHVLEVFADVRLQDVLEERVERIEEHSEGTVLMFVGTSRVVFYFHPGQHPDRELHLAVQLNERAVPGVELDRNRVQSLNQHVVVLRVLKLQQRLEQVSHLIHSKVSRHKLLRKLPHLRLQLALQLLHVLFVDCLVVGLMRRHEDHHDLANRHEVRAFVAHFQQFQNVRHLNQQPFDPVQVLGKQRQNQIFHLLQFRVLHLHLETLIISDRE